MSIPQLSTFFRAVKEDPRMTTAHISLYMALFERWNVKDFTGPVQFKRQDVMEVAKISGRATYHKCLKDLAAYGYIRYVPSFNPAVSSLAYLLV